MLKHHILFKHHQKCCHLGWPVSYMYTDLLSSMHRQTRHNHTTAKSEGFLDAFTHSFCLPVAPSSFTVAMHRYTLLKFVSRGVVSHITNQ